MYSNKLSNKFEMDDPLHEATPLSRALKKRCEERCTIIKSNYFKSINQNDKCTNKENIDIPWELLQIVQEGLSEVHSYNKNESRYSLKNFVIVFFNQQQADLSFMEFLFFLTGCMCCDSKRDQPCDNLKDIFIQNKNRLQNCIISIIEKTNANANVTQLSLLRVSLHMIFMLSSLSFRNRDRYAEFFKELFNCKELFRALRALVLRNMRNSNSSWFGTKISDHYWFLGLLFNLMQSGIFNKKIRKRIENLFLLTKKSCVIYNGIPIFRNKIQRYKCLKELFNCMVIISVMRHEKEDEDK